MLIGTQTGSRKANSEITVRIQGERIVTPHASLYSHLYRIVRFEIVYESASIRITAVIIVRKKKKTLFEFRKNDIILMGRESAGVPEEVHQKADARLLIPMNRNARSINVALSAVMVVGECLRQTGTFPVQED